MGSPAAPTLGTFDKCPRCRQPCDGDLPCPSCGAAPALAEASAPERGHHVVEEINGHLFFADEDGCTFCGTALARAASTRCGS